jgi:L-fuculose-phosphate aldolase
MKTIEVNATERALRQEMVKACKVLYAAKAAGDGLGGHLSVKLDNERMLIKPRPVSWWGLQPEDLIVLDFNGKRVDAPPDSRSAVQEWPIHARIYNARPDVGCVLHAHPASSTLMAALGIAVEPVDQDCAAFTGKLPVLDNGGASISTVERGDELAAALGKMSVVLVRNHGFVVAGSEIADVCVTAHRIEKVAETMLRAVALAKPPLVSAEARAAILSARKAAEPGGSERKNRERWQMMQDYYLKGQE